jgi:putative ABC transport system substrate-binding protein
MNKIFYRPFGEGAGLIFLIIYSLSSCRQHPEILPTIPAKHILIINSDQSVDKYKTIQRAFESEIQVKTITINLAEKDLSPAALQQHILQIQPLLVYTIGSKAYIQSAAIIKDIPLLFSSMINWRRFTLGAHTYGISLELPAEMPLFIYSYLFPEIRTLGVLYSEDHNQQWFNLALSQAQELELSLLGQAVDNSDEIVPALQQLLPQVDAIWLISDPVILYNTKQVQKIFATAAEQQKPIFAYDTLFSKYGAVLTIAADIPTMGRQAAGFAQDLLKQQPIAEPVQFPAGSHVTLNLKKVHEYGITINHTALSVVENIIQ